jgi:hypothetical protein
LATLALPPVLAGDATGGPTDVDLLLVLAIDCSDSVVAAEYRLQIEGLGQALASPEVAEAIASGPQGRIAVTVVLWAGATVQRVTVPWTRIAAAEEAAALGARIALLPRRAVSGETSISGAIDFAMATLAASPFRAPRRVIDVSGDGPNSDGEPVEEARSRAVGAGVVVNGLAIVNDFPNLDIYFGDRVIGGRGSFVIEARDFGHFRDAMQRKLVREILTPSA